MFEILLYRRKAYAELDLHSRIAPDIAPIQAGNAAAAFANMKALARALAGTDDIHVRALPCLLLFTFPHHWLQDLFKTASSYSSPAFCFTYRFPLFPLFPSGTAHGRSATPRSW
jgi:hypothetical protein